MADTTLPVHLRLRGKLDEATERLALRAALTASHLLGLATGTHLRQLRGQNDPLVQLQVRLEEAELKTNLAWEANEMLIARFARLPGQRRPYFTPAQRFRILEINRIAGRSGSLWLPRNPLSFPFGALQGGKPAPYPCGHADSTPTNPHHRSCGSGPPSGLQIRSFDPTPSLLLRFCRNPRAHSGALARTGERPGTSTRTPVPRQCSLAGRVDPTPPTEHARPPTPSSVGPRSPRS